MFWLKFIFVSRRSLLYNNNVFPVLENENWLFFLVLDSLSENHSVSENLGLLKNNVGNKLT